jgi:hypothetical protein
MPPIGAGLLLFWPTGTRTKCGGRRWWDSQDHLAEHITRAQMLNQRRNTVRNTAQALADDLQPAAQPT